MKPKLLRITTIPLSLHKLLQGQLSYMQEKGFEVVLATSEGKEIDQETGLKVNIIPFKRKIALFQDLKALWHTYKLIKNEKPDIVHTHTPKAGLLGMLAAKFARVPVRMHTVAGLPLMQATGIKRKILNFTERLTSWSATQLYSNSFALADFMIANNLAPKRKIKIIANGSSNGIDTSYFNPASVSGKTQLELKKTLNIKSGDFVFTFIGRLVGDKGINELVEAFASTHFDFPSTPLRARAQCETLSDRFDSVTSTPLSHRDSSSTNECDSKGTERSRSAEMGNIKLLLVGDQEVSLDPLKPNTIKSIEENPNILTPGWVDDVRPYLAISEVFVFPSYREGMPNVVLQAGAMGLPQIVTDINGSNEIIIEDENGIIIPVKDTAALLGAMQQMLDPALRKRLSENARVLISSRFEQQLVWEALLTEYHLLLDKRIKGD